MNFELTIEFPNSEPLKFSLPAGRSRLGRHPGCELVVDFAEFADCSAEFDVRGQAVFVTNRNQFPIYVGSELLQAGGATEWDPQEAIQLTANATLRLADVSIAEEEDTEDKASKTMRSTFQLAVIAACVAIAPFLLSPNDDSTKTASTTDIKEQFDKLISEYSTQATVEGRVDYDRLNYEQRTTLDYLVNARRVGKRYSKRDPDRALDAYRRLRDYGPIRRAGKAGADQESLAYRTRQFALKNIMILEKPK